MEPAERQAVIDEQHLWLLSFFHFVSGAVAIAFSGFFLLQLAFFGFIVGHPALFSNADDLQAEGAIQTMRFMLLAMSSFIVLGLLYGIAEIASGFWIKQRKRRVWSLVVAIPRIVMFPYGSLLSLFTFVVLERPSIKKQYG